MTRIAINGFGRIGRIVFKFLSEIKDFQIVAINDLTNPKTLAHLLKYDSIHGVYPEEIKATENSIIVGKKEIKILAEKDASKLPWKDLKIDLVIESTGFYTSLDKASAHLLAGAKKVVISAPASGNLKTIVYNVNHKTLNKEDKIISAASCTTNCLAPVIDVLEREFGVVKGFMNTIHSYTNDQRVQDAPHKDLRRARAAGVNIIPTSTGAAAAVGKVIPAVNGKLDGMAMRVPTICGSIVDLTVELKKSPSIDELNKAMKKASNETLAYNEDPIVSTDILDETHGSIYDSTLTMKMTVDGKDLYKLFAWYDNETSYTNQLVRTIKFFAKI